jgi:hypothetical protein
MELKTSPLIPVSKESLSKWGKLTWLIQVIINGELLTMKDGDPSKFSPMTLVFFYNTSSSHHIWIVVKDLAIYNYWLMFLWILLSSARQSELVI